LEVKKDIYVYRSRKEHIEIIEKKIQLWKTTRKNKKHDLRTKYDSTIHS
jgi:prefoldin subunit 5